MIVLGVGFGRKKNETTQTIHRIFTAASLPYVGRYADELGTVIPGALFEGAENAGIVEYIGADGLEEMHVFLGLAWFDQGSWAWAHFIAEWGTRGIFQVSARSRQGKELRRRDISIPKRQEKHVPRGNARATREMMAFADDTNGRNTASTMCAMPYPSFP